MYKCKQNLLTKQKCCRLKIKNLIWYKFSETEVPNIFQVLYLVQDW